MSFKILANETSPLMSSQTSSHFSNAISDLLNYPDTMSINSSMPFLMYPTRSNQEFMFIDEDPLTKDATVRQLWVVKPRRMPKPVYPKIK